MFISLGEHSLDQRTLAMLDSSTAVAVAEVLYTILFPIGTVEAPVLTRCPSRPVHCFAEAFFTFSAVHLNPRSDI